MNLESEHNIGLVHTEEAIAHHEVTPQNRLENQIRLATDLFEFLIGEKVDFTNRDQRNDVMEYWVEKGYSKAYRELEQDEIFKTHPRLQGNIFTLTFEDIKQYFENKTLPE